MEKSNWILKNFPIDRIFGGSDSDNDDYFYSLRQYTIAIFKGTQFVCTGALLNNVYVCWPLYRYFPLFIHDTAAGTV